MEELLGLVVVLLALGECTLAEIEIDLIVFAGGEGFGFGESLFGFLPVAQAELDL